MGGRTVRLLASAISHMALHFVWRDSGVTEGHGFDLVVDCCGVSIDGGPAREMRERAPTLLDGTYDMLSGLHHETYVYRARGDKRFVYLAQAQNDWDDRFITRPEIGSVRDLHGKKVLVSSRAPCVSGNLMHALRLAGADLGAIDFVHADPPRHDDSRAAVEAVARGEAAAANVDLPFDVQAAKRGLRTLALPSVPVIHNTTMCANREWVAANEELTLAILRSMVDAIHFFKTQPQRTCEILERRLAPLVGIEGDDEIEHLQRSWAALLSPKPYPHPLAIWNVYDLEVSHDPKVSFIGPLEIWDTSYLRRIDDAGYIDALYGGAPAAANPAVAAVI